MNLKTKEVDRLPSISLMELFSDLARSRPNGVFRTQKHWVTIKTCRGTGNGIGKVTPTPLNTILNVSVCLGVEFDGRDFKVPSDS